MGRGLKTERGGRFQLEEAAALAREVAAAAKISGTRAERPTAALSHGLTARESQAPRLVAAGRSNREIADALFISVPTVKRHLPSILGKLDLPSRSALNTYAHAHGLV